MSEVKVKKQKEKQDQKDPVSLFRAELDTNSFNADSGTIDVVFATEMPVLQRDYYSNELYYEVLSLDPKHVRIDRLRSGGPVLDSHQKWGGVQYAQIGVVTSADIVKKQGVASLKFSKREDLKPLIEDIKDGIVKNISAGYRVYQYDDISKPGDTHRTLMAIDWEPTEISFVPIPADYMSKVRALKNILPAAITPASPTADLDADSAVITETNNENKIRANNTMEEIEKKVAPAAVAPVTPVTPGSDAGGLAERKRNLEITEVVRTAKLDAAFAEKHIQDGTTIEKVRELVIQEWARAQTEITPSPVNNAVTTGFVASGVDNEAIGRVRSFEEAIMVRSFGVDKLGKDGPTTDYGKRAAGGRRITLMEHGIRSLQAQGVNTDYLSEGEIFNRAMSTGDFPIALANVMNKTLRQRYEQATPVWQKFAKKVPAKDFKPLFSVQVDGNTKPGKLTEAGEYPNVFFKEAGDNFKLDTYGLTTAVTRQMFINDDLSAFQNFGPYFSDGMIANQTELIYAALLGTDGLGRVLHEDNTKVFNAAKHFNLDATGAAMSIASFTAAVTAMRRQKTLAGRKMNNNRPTYLVIPPELETLAYQLINATIVPNTTSQANPFKGLFEILVEDFLDDIKAWFLFSDPSRVESVKYATLDGQEGIFTEQWWNPKNDCWEIKARNDFSATIEEFRGVYKNVGV